MKLTSQYANLGQQFSRRSLPEKPTQAQLLLWNQSLAAELNLDVNAAQQGAYFSGKELLPGSKPIATAYSGHQFGHFNPQLGDGRAHLLGETTDHHNNIQEIQLKGSGRTPFSRNGDGKCGIKPAVREYIMSEAMYALGVPTTRCLSVVTTGEDIFRQTSTPGAVVSRVATSHLRVGTFEYFAARKKFEELKIIADLAIERHFHEIGPTDDERYLKLLSYVIDKQIVLITQWMRIGFIHGVMNTDNTLLSGDTIDYGPCAMLGLYDPTTVFSSIDQNGRYAFGNQPNIAQWNIARFAECLIPLINDDEKVAIEKIMPLLNQFPEKYNRSYEKMMGQKLGFNDISDASKSLSQSLLKLMFENQLDYTQTYLSLNNSLSRTDQLESLSPALLNWRADWLKVLKKQKLELSVVQDLMHHTNPLVIPRNHHMETVLQDVESSLSVETANKFLEVLRSPYSMVKHTHEYQEKSPDDDLNYQTYCGT